MPDTSSPRTIAIVGATSAIAHQCARLWLAAGGVDRLVLIGRDGARLPSVAADLQVRQPGTRIETIATDMLQPETIAGTVRGICADGVPDLVLIAHGNLPDQPACEADLAAARQALEVNGISPALWAEAFAGAQQSRGHGRIGIIGSVAGDRGRQSNYVYGAAKGLVERYAQGLQHRLAGTGVRVTLVKPGPTDTPMTAHLKAQGARLATPEEVADAIVRGMARGAAVVYAPAKWALIMLVIRHLPRAVFHRMKI
ncbi:SDR family NAD(P)-dependent oxidoreductase [Paracidovorax avenae]|uniref:SDR family NAD(P)-dependent oxidoreductase n=1 Tax=Paracidovorax avenae TaxID=80867 RepID=UPI000D20A76B|nr:SDR family NAD(P)-dependent oxidoreductase [Paracidovorax avenae]AVT01107.1 short-chain dehydrogenase [Paracidovorax avenae]AVT08112.1 short-chain dehydrogenase [Paracidovorax avenae]